MNEWPVKGDEVTFYDPDTATYRDGTVLGVWTWHPDLPSVMVEFRSEGCTIAKTVSVNNVFKRGYNPHARCECGSEKIGEPGHAHYCPKFV